ncbi:hypothetical protein CLOM_g11825 [Closterium sp. NIES-68]|nr:hypothetical protein CLOM_g11825 [Closterium sp. NIES-68]GJP84568.1 hypothetical protein CLOP_g14627 [Closterium sp. NIES-67]
MKVYAHWDGDPHFTLIAVVADRAVATTAGDKSGVRTAGELLERFASAFNAKHPSHAPLSPSLLSLHKARGQLLPPTAVLSKAAHDLDDLFVRQKVATLKPLPPAQQQQQQQQVGAEKGGKEVAVGALSHGVSAMTVGPPTARSPPAAAATPSPAPASRPSSTVRSAPAAAIPRTPAAPLSESPLTLPLVRHAAQQMLHAQRQGQYRHAILLANQLLAVAPNLKLCYRALAAMHMAISRHDRALPVLQAAVEAHPSDALLVLRLAQATLHLAQPSDALSLADRALSLASQQGWPQHSTRRRGVAGQGGGARGMVGVLGSRQSASRMMQRARVSGQQAAEMFGLPEEEEDDDEGEGGEGGRGKRGAGGAWDVESPYVGDPHGDLSLDDIKVVCGRALLQVGAVDVASAVVAGVLQGDEHHEDALVLYGDVLLRQTAGKQTPHGQPAESPNGCGAQSEENEGGGGSVEEEAMKAYLRVLLARPHHATARAKMAHVLQHHPSARRLLLSQLQSGAGPPADTARALVFFASACKDHSALDAALALMQRAVALTPGCCSHVLALLHLHEVMLHGCAALHLALSFCHAHPDFRLGPITLAALLPFFQGLPLHAGSCEDVSPCPHERGVQLEYLRWWDGGGSQDGGGGEAGANGRGADACAGMGTDAGAGGGGKGEGVGAGEGTEEYRSEELDVLAMLMTAVKALFLGGAVRRAKALGALVERARVASKVPLHETLIRNEAAYFGCAFQLLTHYPITHSLSHNSPPPLFLAGDSHCLAAAWRVVHLRGQPRLLCPLLITGLKAWHLRPESTFFPKASFHRAMQCVPPGSEVVVLFGEIDCREGILVSVDRNKYNDVEEGVEVTVDIYLAALLSLIAARGFEIFVHPVPSIIPDTRPLARIYNATLRRRCLAAAASPAAGGRLHMLDFFPALLTHDQESLRPEFEFDGTHMNPRYVPLLDKELSRIPAP